MSVSLFSKAVRILLPAFIAIEIFFILWLIADHRLGFHDTAGAFFNQYYRFNSLVQYGQIPLWTPFMTQGATLAWSFVLGGAGFLFDALLLLGPWLKHADFPVLFNASYFFIEIPFLIGVWLLTGRYFLSVMPRVFVMLCVVSGFTIHTQGFWLNFIYMVPLIMWLLHRFIDSGHWRWLFLAGYLYLVSIVTSNLYLIPVSSFLIVMYFSFDACGQTDHYARWIRSLRFGKPFGMCMAGIALMALLAFLYISSARDMHSVIGSFLRNSDGSSDLGTFLTYAGNTDLNKWNELLLRASSALDFTLYMGFFALPCVLAAFLFSRRHEMRVWAGWTAMLLLFSIGSFVAIVLYYFWPLMNFYRHLCLLAPVVKFGLCFLAGFGFQALFEDAAAMTARQQGLRSVFFMFMVVLLIGWGCFVHELIHNTGLRELVLGSLVTQGLPSFGKAIFSTNLFIVMAFTGILAGACLVMVFVRTPRALLVMALVWLFFQAADVYSYRVSQMRLRTVKVNDTMLASMKWDLMPWRDRRDPAQWLADDRDLLLSTRIGQAALYNNVGNFIWRDYFSTAIRTDQWQRPLDDYLRAYTGLSFDAPQMVNSQTPYRLYFDLPASARKISGVTRDKIQVFSSAHYLSSREKVAAVITDPSYAGDIIFISHPDHVREDDPVPAALLSLNERFEAVYRVVRFTPNEVVVQADNPGPRPAWLLYSDIWHPYWKARVNGKPSDVYVANLAYKAVELAPGRNEVAFYFHAPLLVFFQWLFVGHALVMLGIVGWAAAEAWKLDGSTGKV